MESEIIQHLKDEVKKEKLPDLEKMTTEQLKRYITKRFPVKERLRLLINCIYLAVQQSYKDSRPDDQETLTFSIIEGEIKKDLKNDTYYFYPNEQVKRLLEHVDHKSTTRLKTLLSSKFYKILEYLYNMEMNSYDKAEKDLAKLSPKALELALANEKQNLNMKYKDEFIKLNNEIKTLKTEIDLLNEDKMELNKIIDQQEEIIKNKKGE